MFAPIQSIIFLLYSLIDKQYSAKLRFAMAQISIMKEKLPGNRVIVSPAERKWLLAIAADGGPGIIDALGIVSKRTFRRWLWEERQGKIPKRVGRKRKFGDEVRALLLRFSLENCCWGTRRIAGEMKKLAINISPSSVRRILKEEGRIPPPDKIKRPNPGVPWTTFVSAHIDSMMACDFFTKTLWTIQGPLQAYFLVFIHLGSRKVFCSSATLSPNENWVLQQARNAAMWMEDQHISLRFLVRDNDTKFTKSFDAFFKTMALGEKGGVIRTAYQAPQMNSFAESFIGTLKRESLDYFVCISLSQMDHIVHTYIKYYNTHRPHQGKGIDNRVLDKSFKAKHKGEIKCQQFLGGLLKHYYRTAA